VHEASWPPTFPITIGVLIVGAKMGHYPMFEQPESLADIVVDFLRRRNVV
jgi:pimeloyl-ACP methyl ester carboxylesterase